MTQFIVCVCEPEGEYITGVFTLKGLIDYLDYYDSDIILNVFVSGDDQPFCRRMIDNPHFSIHSNADAVQVRFYDNADDVPLPPMSLEELSEFLSHVDPDQYR